MLIIGINGKKQVGKSTFALNAADLLPGQVAELSFAFPLKKFCIDYLGLPPECCFGTDDQKEEVVGTWGEFFGNPALLAKHGKEPEELITGREVLQIVGTEVFRENLRPTIWIDIAKRRLENRHFDLAFQNGRLVPPQIDGQPKLVCITDARFPNEIDWLKDDGHKLVRIYRYTGKGDSIAHASETVFDQIPDSLFDHVIYEDQNKNLKQARQNAIQILHNEGLMDSCL